VTTPGSDVHDVYVHVVDVGPLLRRLARIEVLLVHIEVLLVRIARAVNAEGEIMTEPTTPVEPTEPEPDDGADTETSGQ
jgi:hypothetical protein